MAKSLEEWKEQAQLAQELGDDNAELEAREAIDAISSGSSPIQSDSGLLEATGQTIDAMGRSVVGEIGGGLSGLIELAMTQDPEKAAAAVNSFREGIAATPGERSQEQLKSLGGVVEAVADKINIPLSGIAGITDIATGQGLEKSVDTIGNIQDQGFIKASGERAFEETGSPAIAAATEAGLTAIPDIIGLKGAQVGARGVGKTADVFTRQSKFKDDIGRMLSEGSDDVPTAKFELENPFDAGLKEDFRVGAPKVRKDKQAIEAIKQGFDEGTIAVTKGSSNTDKAKMLQMVEQMKQIKKNKLFADDNRITDIVGESLTERAKHVLEVNKRAGKQVDEASKALKGKVVNFDNAADNFLNDLDELGVSVGDDLKPKYFDSTLEFNPTDQKVINNVMELLVRNQNKPDALNLHKLKKTIDNQVTYGKTTEGGLSNSTSNALKGLRTNINKELGDFSPNYKKANATFSETIDALDSLQDVAGKKMNLTGVNADQALGTLSKRLVGNAQTRIPLKEAINKIESIAKKHGGEFDDNIGTQLLFAHEMEDLFKTAPRKSLQGEVNTAIRQGADLIETPARAGIGIVAQGAEKLRGINDVNAIKAIEELLKK